jgi:ATP-dependent protease HslVU (ClpYQ) peptidase subunit
MTTIAANLSEMAGDSRVTVGSICYHTDKVFRIGDSIVGVAGDANNTTKFLAWMRKECPPDEVGMILDDEHTFSALVLNPRGLFYYCDCVEPDRVHDKCMAIGSGADIAVTAMHFGKTPTEAVHVACKLNTSDSGGPVKTIQLPRAASKGKKIGARQVRSAQSVMPPKGAQTDTPSSTQE